MSYNQKTMFSLITTVFTVIACFIVYSYMKKKYANQIQQLQDIISGLNLDLIKSRTEVREVDSKLHLAQQELSITTSRLETTLGINKDLAANRSTNIVSAEPKKRGRKPGSKRPYYRKKTGGNPS